MNLIFPECYEYQVYTTECSRQLWSNIALMVFIIIIGIIIWWRLSKKPK
jgi:plastocyanin domain-containing protein